MLPRTLVLSTPVALVLLAAGWALWLWHGAAQPPSPLMPDASDEFSVSTLVTDDAGSATPPLDFGLPAGPGPVSAGEAPINAGVLELAHGSIVPPLALEFCLKNKSQAHSRTVRLACINADGRFSDVSPVFEIKPNGTLVIRLPEAGLEKPRNAGQEIAPETWRDGSVNVIWVGRGAEPVTGHVISGIRGAADGVLRDRVVLPLWN